MTQKFHTYIDGNSVGHAAQHGGGKTRKLYAGSQETTAIFGMLKSMHKILRGRTHAPPVVLWDGRSWRYSFFPDYKSNRTDTLEKQKDRERYRAQRRAMFVGLKLLGVKQLVADNMEADDLAAILTRRAVARGDQVRLITGDQDWLQLVQPGVVWIEHRGGKDARQCNAVGFKSFTGYDTPRAFVDAKSLQGDTGDFVKPKTGIGKKGAVDLLSVFPSIKEFLATPLDEAKDRYFLQIGKNMPKAMVTLHTDKEVQGRVEWAAKLMDLSHPEIPAPVGLKATHEPLDREKFEKFCGKLAFTSLLRDMDNFLKPFISLDKGDNL